MGFSQPLDPASRIPLFTDSDNADFRASVYTAIAGTIGPDKYLPYPIDDAATHALTETLGTVYHTLIPIPDGEAISHISVATQAEAEDTPVAAQCFIGIYDANGNLLWTSPDGSAAGWVNTPGYYQLAVPGIIVPKTGKNYVYGSQLVNADASGLIPWCKTLVAVTPAVAGTAGTGVAGSGARAFTGRTGATGLAATIGALTGILNVPFVALG